MTGATGDNDSAWNEPIGAGEGRPWGDPEPRAIISTTPADVPDSGTSAYTAALAARNRRKRVAGTLLGVVVVGAVIGGVIALDASDESTARPEATAATTTAAPAPTRPPGIGLPAQVVLGRLEPLNSAAAGTVASTGDVGAILERGDVVGLVDTRPVALFYGDEPFARELSLGDAGTDVRQLEANLAALGFDDGGAMSVDLDYTGATAAAVAEWEASIGIARSGVVPVGRLTVAAGPVRLAEVVAPGTPVAAGEPLARAILLRRIDDLVQDGSGVLTGPLPPGSAIGHGDTLHQLGESPVLAVTEPSDFVSSVLDPLSAGDMQGVESALVFFGYDPDRVIVVDSNADLATLAAFARWQTAVGLPETLALGGEFYITAPAGSTICRTHVSDGQSIENGALAYTVESPTVVVEARVPVEQEERFGVGEVVMVEVSDGLVARAVVVRSGDDAADPASVATSAATEATEPVDTSTIPVVLVVIDAPPTVLGGPATLLPEAEEPEGTGAEAAGDTAASCSVVDP
jgi:peptidoglycan hydrolase-like protein with peptidoglycan-binding domain